MENNLKGKPESFLIREKIRERTPNKRFFGFSFKKIFQMTTSAAIGCFFGKGYYKSVYYPSADFKKEYNLVPSIVVGVVAGFLAMACYMVQNYFANRRSKIN